MQDITDFFKTSQDESCYFFSKAVRTLSEGGGSTGFRDYHELSWYISEFVNMTGFPKFPLKGGTELAIFRFLQVCTFRHSTAACECFLEEVLWLNLVENKQIFCGQQPAGQKEPTLLILVEQAPFHTGNSTRFWFWFPHTSLLFSLDKKGGTCNWFVEIQEKMSKTKEYLWTLDV